MKSNEFVTSDIHFGHKRILELEGRPFDTVEEMDAFLVAAWNTKVPPNGTVYVLGDISFHNRAVTRWVLEQLNGSLRIVRGGHDKGILRALEERAEWVRDYYESKTDDGRKVVMFHYPLVVWEKAEQGAWMLHGHCHGNLPDEPIPRFDVGIDAHPTMQPFSYAEVATAMRGRKWRPVDHHGG
jgi:calcineurin-like phosphoesterase family protein